MSRARRLRAAAVSAALVAVAMLPLPGPAGADATARPGHGWVGTWAAAPSGVADNGCTSCTIRDVVHTSVGGTQVRIRLSNAFGTAVLRVAHATVALPSVPSSAQVAPGTMREVSFGGAAQVRIPRGGSVVSDPVRLDVPADHDLLVTTFTPGYPTPMTFHPDAQQDSYFTSGADQAAATAATALPQKTQAWHFLTGVDVAGAPTVRQTVVAFGDSITDGFRSTADVDHRWPNFLAGRVLQQPAARRYGVVDAGIGGNRVLLDGGNSFGPAAVDRFRRDALGQTGVRTVIVLEGINDIQQEPHQLDPTAIESGLRTLVRQAHARGVRVIGGTITPFEGWSTYDAQEEATREAVNTWIRSSRVFDAVVDFDAAVRDPADAHRLLPAYDSGDHLHPDDLGYSVMGDAVDLRRL